MEKGEHEIHVDTIRLKGKTLLNDTKYTAVRECGHTAID